MNIFYKRIVIIISIYSLTACQKLVEVGEPHGKIVSSLVFSSDRTADASVRGLYSIDQLQLGSSTIYFSNSGVTIIGGLSSDELTYVGNTATLQLFNANDLTPGMGTIDSYMWSWAYQIIYHANACIEGLQQATDLTTSLRDQLLGESLFVRAFWYFNLMNFFGDIPLITTTDYGKNGMLPRTPVSEIYDQLMRDLEQAVDLMGDLHISEKHHRPSKWTAAALLARIYLYQENWEQAEKYANEVIRSGSYQLVPELSQVFLNQSPEALWQVATVSSSNPIGYTTEGTIFMRDAVLNHYRITNPFYISFEEGDIRRSEWISMRTIGGEQSAYPVKYKNIRGMAASTPPEGYVMMRYAEMFLIRAEANIHLNRLDVAMKDLDRLRQRAGLELYSTQLLPTQKEAMQRLEQERRSELFAEWGHRWFDLKRMRGIENSSLYRVGEVMPSLKERWRAASVLFPIPQSQIDLNPNLAQNPGY